MLSTIENPKVNIPTELVTACLISYDISNEYGMTSSVDHPTFAEVRKLLAKNGFIKIPDYPCVNGDKVVKRFIFNDVQLEVDDTFYCASAWEIKLKRSP